MTTFINYITLQTATRLEKFLAHTLNNGQTDALVAHRRRMLEDLIYREGGSARETSTGYSVNIGGVRATSTSGLVGATRNWINSVRKTAAAQAGAK